MSDQKVATLTLNPTSATVKVGQRLALKAVALNAARSAAENAVVSYSSSDQSVATVDDTCVVTGVRAGTATITAKSGAIAATCAITVK
jgi:uncharacterized protein YjdB